MLTVAAMVLLATVAASGQPQTPTRPHESNDVPHGSQQSDPLLGGTKRAATAAAQSAAGAPPYLWTEESFAYRELGVAAQNTLPGTLQLPFAVAFAGRSWAELYIDDAGYVSFSGRADTLTHDLLPSSHLSFAIAPLWDEFVRAESASLRWGVLGAEPHRELVLEWNNLMHVGCDAPSGATFQLVLFEDSADLFFNYAAVGFSGACATHDLGGSATVGLQTDATTAVTFSHDQPLLHDRMTLRWRANLPANPEPSISMLQPDAWAVDGSPVAVIVRGSDLQPGTTVLWDGAPRAANYLAENEIYFVLSGADLARTGVHYVAALNALPGGGASNARTFTVAQPDFKLQPGASSLTLGSNGSLMLGITVEPISVFRQDVTLSCTNLPADWRCSFSPATVNPQGMPVVSALTITNTRAQGATRVSNARPPRALGHLLWFAIMVPVGLAFYRSLPQVREANTELVPQLREANLGGPRQLTEVPAPVLEVKDTGGAQPGKRTMWLGALLLLTSLALLACGGGGGSVAAPAPTPVPSTPPAAVARTVTVVATGGGIQHTCSFTVVAAK